MLRPPRPPRGWTVQYLDPRFGTRSLVVRTLSELNATKRWIENGGYSFSVEVLR